MPFARRLAPVALLAAATCLAAGLPVVTADPAAAASNEVYRVPPNRVFYLEGHGWGHGHGMSQYGAYGAAKVRGLSYQQILAFYYPHATLVGQPTSTTVRVLLHSTSSDRLPVVPRAGGNLTVATSVAGIADCRLPTSLDGGKTTVASWRAKVVSTPDGPRLRLQVSPDGTAWKRAKVPACDAAWSSPMDGSITFADAAYTKLVRGGAVTAYRGKLRAAFTGSRIYVVNTAPLESYLQSVVPSEMPSSWSPAALQAQAVAARSYASYEIAHPKNAPYYDVYDDTRDQMYVGMPGEAASSTAAV
ncbi:MAG: hypothetical protein QOF18_1442, partial [Frankiaceae bacterium]|nr:hypothetical protein [Frankiaceae bacterium]